MFLYNDVYYTDESCKMAVKLKKGHCNVITFHKNCQTITAGFAPNDYTISEVTFPENLESIGEEAFNNCKGLKVVNFNNKLRNIEKFVFANTALKTITFPASLEYIRHSSFRNCSNLESVNFEENSKLSRISKTAFYECNLKKLILPDSIRHIENNAFGNNSKLEYIKIGKNVNRIESLAFILCDNIKKIDIDKTNIDYDNRNDCNAIVETRSNKIIFGNKYTTIPDTIKSIGEKAFYHSSIKNITLPSSLTHIEKSVFAYSSLENITFPEKLKNIDDSAFYCCLNLKQAFIPNNVECVGNSAFSGCISMKSVHFSKNAKIIKSATFKNCEKLKDIYNIGHIEEIKENAFGDCLLLNSIELGNKVRFIGRYAFVNCLSLKNVLLPYNKHLNVDGNAFDNSFIYKQMITDKNLFAIGGHLLKIIPEKEVIVPEGIKEISDKILFGDNTIESLILPSSLKKINSFAFTDCKKLEYVQFNEGLERIGRSAFRGSAIRHLSLPDTIKEICGNAFSYCHNLNTITPFNFKDVKTLGENIFGFSNVEDTSFFNTPFISRSAFHNCEKLEEVFIAPSVRRISENIFENSAVKRIVLHNNLEQILYLGNMPFLEEIIFPGTRKEFEKISASSNLDIYGTRIKTLESLEELIDSNYNLKKLNKLFKDREQITER